MNTAPNAKPPITRWYQQGMSVAPQICARPPTKRPPSTVESIIFQLATFVQIRMNAPMRIAMTQVSPTEPGMAPRNISQKPVPYWAPLFWRASIPPSATKDRGVAPVAPSTRVSPLRRAIQVWEPDISLGYEKKRNALVSRAGFQMFIPVPPKTSLPKITAKATATASIHRGMSTGTMSGMKKPDTR